MSSENHEMRKDVVSWAVVGLFYIVGFFLLFLLSSTSSVILGLVCAVIFGIIFMYNVLNPDGTFSLDNLLDGLAYMLSISLAGVLFLFSIIAILNNFNNLLNM